MNPIRIAIVDDHRVVARSLQSYFESFPEMQVVGLASSGEAAPHPARRSANRVGAREHAAGAPRVD